MSEDEEQQETAEDIDERRLHRKAYDYLCRLLEVRTWLVDCLKDDTISPVIELENNFRNGVLLARLSNVFAPDIVSQRGIFDLDEQRYHANEDTPVYKHTDNIMKWRRAMLSVGMPEILIPETVDVFEGRQIRTIFCLYALATLLYRLRKTPPLRNLAGTAQFTVDEIEEMKRQLRDLNVPEFGEISGLLKGGITADEKAYADAIAAVNTAVDDQNSSALLEALQKAAIHYVETNLENDYLTFLTEEKKKDANNTLSGKAIQSTIIKTNNESALRHLTELLQESEPDRDQLLNLLDTLQIEDTRKIAMPLYITLLKKKILANGGKELTKEQVLTVVELANALAEVKLAVLQGSSEDCLRALNNPILELNPRPDNAKLYYNRFSYNYEKTPEDYFLTRTDLQNVIFEFEELSTEHRDLLELNGALKSQDKETSEIIVKKLVGNAYVEENSEYYFRRLEQSQPSTVDQLKSDIESVNEAVNHAFGHADTLIRLNTAAAAADPSGTRLHLVSAVSSIGNAPYRAELVHWYIKRLINDMRERMEKSSQKKDDHTWYVYEFEFGCVWVETIEHTRSTKKIDPENDYFMNWDEISSHIESENEIFNNHYKQNEDKIEKSQAMVKGFLARKKRRIAQIQEQNRQLAAKKIQSEYKNYRRRKLDKMWKEEKDPSLSVIRNYAGSLHEHEQDTAKQLAVEEARSRVWQLRVANQQTDVQLRELDEKIGLLVKNRINLQDVIAHKDKIADETDHFAIRPASIRRKARDQHDALEQLMYQLQADPKYMASLMLSKELRYPEGFSLIRDCIAPTFGFVTEPREQFLLVRVLCEVMRRKIQHISMLSELHQGEEQESVRQVFGSSLFDTSDPCSSISDELSSFAADDSASTAFNLDPIDIYKSIRGAAPSDVSKALEDSEVEQILTSSKEFVGKWSETFVKGILSRFSMPSALKYLCCYVNDALSTHLPTSTSDDVLHCVAQMAFEVYFRRFLTTPRAIFISSGKGMSSDAAHRLECIVQFIGYAIANRGYGNNKWYLSSLNMQVHSIFVGFRDYIAQQIENVRLDEIYEMNEFTHFDPSHKPTLSILEKQLAVLLKFLKLNSPTLTEGTGSQIHNLLSASSVPDGPADRTITLHLHPASSSGSEDDDKQELFIKAKKLIVDLLLSECKGQDIGELVFTKQSPDCDVRLKEVTGDQSVSTVTYQATLIESLNELEKAGRVSAEDKYQALLTDIANDIRMADRRRKERDEMVISLKETEEKLVAQREELKSRLTQYEQYLDTCLENLSRTSRRLSFRPSSKATERIAKQRLSFELPHSIKSSGEKLFRKGVLVDVKIPGYESVKKLSKLQFELQSSADRKSIFQIIITDGKHSVKQFELDFQDLLHCESADQEKLKVADGEVILDVPKTIQFINKKFYSK